MKVKISKDTVEGLEELYKAYRAAEANCDEGEVSNAYASLAWDEDGVLCITSDSIWEVKQ